MSSRPLPALFATLAIRHPDVFASVLRGEITLNDARMLIEPSPPHTREVVVVSHVRSHDRVLARHPDLESQPFPASESELFEEMGRMSIAARASFEAGHITLFQARYATRQNLTEEQIETCVRRCDAQREEFYERNKQTNEVTIRAGLRKGLRGPAAWLSLLRPNSGDRASV